MPRRVISSTSKAISCPLYYYYYFLFILLFIIGRRTPHRNIITAYTIVSHRPWLTTDKFDRAGGGEYCWRERNGHWSILLSRTHDYSDGDCGVAYTFYSRAAVTLRPPPTPENDQSLYVCARPDWHPFVSCAPFAFATDIIRVSDLSSFRPTSSTSVAWLRVVIKVFFFFIPRTPCV